MGSFEEKSNKKQHKRILAISHQLPQVMTLDQENLAWDFSPRQGHTALYAGIKALMDLKDTPVVHIGWTGICYNSHGDIIDGISDDAKAKLEQELIQDSRIPVYLPNKTAAGHYDGYCKSELWPLFHYILWDQATDGVVELGHWKEYQLANKIFAEKIAKVYQPGDLIWIHDYHLLLLPSILRKMIPKAQIGLFIHTPFPSSEIFRCLPKRKEILEGPLAANLIGFQTYSYARHFISSCTRVLGLESTPKGVNYNGNLVSIAIFPVGIDVEQLRSIRNSTQVVERIATLKSIHQNKKIIIGRDKMDQINGVKHKLLAFEKLLSKYPEWRQNVVMIQLTTPAPNEVPNLEAQISELVSKINGQYGSLEFSPVKHYNQFLDQEEYIALLSMADVGLVTAVRDSMNTTALEYIVCQQGQYGPLVLSEFTGTAGSLSAAIMVNPWNYSGIADALNEALTITREEKFSKHLQLYDHVCRHDALFWATSFIKEMSSTKLFETVDTPLLDNDLVARFYEKANKRLLLFDYDGTLTPIRKVPNAAIPSKDALDALKQLTNDSKNEVYIISGRNQGFLDEWLGGIERLGFSAEHGCFLKSTQDTEWTNLLIDTDLSWKADVLEIFNYYTERTPGSFVEQKEYSITWHYRLADPDFGIFQAKECQNHLENSVLCKLPVEILIGKKNLEVRPVAVNKGQIVKKLMVSEVPFDFIFCAGDDKTDEDMFKALRRTSYPSNQTVFTCTIGPSNKKTAASWHIEQPTDLISLLLQLSE